MRKTLTPEQVKKLIAEIDAWKVQAIPPEKVQRWQKAQIVSIEQLTEIEEVEVYNVVLRFPEGHEVSFMLRRVAENKLDACATLTYYEPDFTHPSQNK